MPDETLTQALASLGYSHRRPTADDRAKFGKWILGQTIVSPDGDSVGIMYEEDAWALVRRLRAPGCAA